MIDGSPPGGPLPCVLQVVHGYPPRETAGTEVYTRRVAEGLARRGWRVVVAASTRSPGHPHGAWLPAEVRAGVEVHRRVDNLPWRPPARAERDAAAERALGELVERVAPDLVHVQHLVGWSSALRWPVPALGTLHDAWAWCLRGGTLLQDGRTPCPGPSAARCPPCHATWAAGAPLEHLLARAAGGLGRWCAPERLQAGWRLLPPRLRALVRRGRPRPPSPAALERRLAATRAAWARLDLRLAPSRYLARLAEGQGLGPVEVLPHGVPPSPHPRTGDGPLLHLGSLVPHKGPDLVVRAWERLGPDRPPLVLHGPSTDPAYAARLPAALLGGPVPSERVPALLARARALVMGSRWPENAPLVVLEARAAGCPVVAPRIGGIPEILQDGVDGALYAPDEVEALARAMRRVLAAPPVPRPPPTFEHHLTLLEARYRALLGKGTDLRP